MRMLKTHQLTHIDKKKPHAYIPDFYMEPF